MNKTYKNSFDYRRLREKAEKRIFSSADGVPETTPDPQEMRQDLQIYQMELVIQNEELKQTQQELENLLARYVGLYYDQSPYGYVTLSAKGIIQKLNLAAAGFLGTERVNVQHMAFSNFLAPACQMNYFFALKKADKTLTQQSVELELIPSHETSRKWILAHIMPDTTDGAQCYQYRIGFMEITEYREDQIRYQQMEKMYEDLFADLPVACHFMNRKAEILRSNLRWEAITGYASPRSGKTQFLNYVHPDWRARVEKIFMDSISSRSCRQFQFSMLHRNGTPIDVEAMILPCSAMNEEQISACCCLFEKRAVKRAATGETDPIVQPFSNMEALPFNFMQVDREGRIVYANRACHTALGAEPGALAGRFQWALASDPDEARRIREWFRYKLSHHPFPEPFHLKFRHPDRKPIQFQLDWHYIHDPSGSVTGFLNHLTDISKTEPVQYAFIHAMTRKNETLLRLRQELEEARELKNLLLKNEQTHQKKLETHLQSRIETLILPYIEQMKQTRLTDHQAALIDILVSNFQEIFDPFLKRIGKMDNHLTLVELKVADLVKKGKTNKEIAQILSISSRTVGFHRESLRKKFDIVNKKINLRSLLLSMDR